MRYTKQQEFSIIRYLRWRQFSPAQSKYTYMALSPIAKFLNRLLSHVAKCCKEIKERDAADEDS